MVKQNIWTQDYSLCYLFLDLRESVFKVSIYLMAVCVTFCVVYFLFYEEIELIVCCIKNWGIWNYCKLLLHTSRLDLFSKHENWLTILESCWSEFLYKHGCVAILRNTECRSSILLSISKTFGIRTLKCGCVLVFSFRAASHTNIKYSRCY